MAVVVVRMRPIKILPPQLVRITVVNTESPYIAVQP